MIALSIEEVKFTKVCDATVTHRTIFYGALC